MRALPSLAFLIWLSPSLACAGPRSSPYALELIDENGDRLPTYSHDGRTYVLGHEGDRYSLRIRNQSYARVEFVTSVDGRDVLDGNPANWNRRGYVVDPWSQVVIDGFRLDRDSVAAFRFGSVRDSYAARMGDARDVGVIGVAVFSERRRVVQTVPMLQAPRRPSADTAPTDSNAFGSGGLGTGFGNVLGESAGAAGMGKETRVVPGRTIAQGISEGPRAGLAASKKGAPSVAQVDEAPGLGTEVGEKRDSRVTGVDFERAGSQPIAQLMLRYDDRQGLLALGIDVAPRHHEREVDRRENAQPFRENFCTPPTGWEP